MSKTVVVIGGGPAGMMAAGKAAERGNRVVLLEKNNRLGRKLYICGKGRCNLTNYSDIKELIANIPGNGKFLYSSFSRFSSYDIIEFFNELGVETKVERGKRVFPESDKASEVVDALARYIKDCGVEIRLESKVNKILVEDNKVMAVCYNNDKTVLCDAVILATGGLSYPGTGSTGDGYKFAEELGHTIISPKPSLVPLVVKEEWVKNLQGLSLKNIKIELKKGSKLVYSDFGEMLFTHYGVSGPVILSASRHLLDYDYRDIELYIDLKPALSEEKLDIRILRDFEKYNRKIFINALDDLLPQKMIPVVVNLSGISPEKTVNQINREERLKLVKLLKYFKLTPVAPRPIKEAIVTAGGVNIKEITPSTMESKLVRGLFFAGEVIDVDAYTGGFNLTIAFSTGYTAGTNV